MRIKRLALAAMVGLAMMLGTGFGVAGAQPINPPAPEAGDAVHLVDERGDTLATVTVTGVERDWTGYKSTFKPRKGVEFVAFTLQIEAVEGDLEVDGKDFDLQRDPGILEDSSSVQPESDDPPALRGKVSIEEGDTATFLLVFEVPEGSGLSNLFWAPDNAFLTIQYLGDL